MWGHQPPSLLRPFPLFPPPFLFPLHLFPSPPIFLPPLRSRPLTAAMGLRGAKRYLVNLRLKISTLVAAIFRSFSGNEHQTGWRSGTCWTAREAFSLITYTKIIDRNRRIIANVFQPSIVGCGTGTKFLSCPPLFKMPLNGGARHTVREGTPSPFYA